VRNLAHLAHIHVIECFWKIMKSIFPYALDANSRRWSV